MYNNRRKSYVKFFIPKTLHLDEEFKIITQSMKRIFVDPRLLELTKTLEISREIVLDKNKTIIKEIIYNNGSFRTEAAWDFLHTLYINLYFLTM